MGINWTETPLATLSAPRGTGPSLRLSRLLRDRLFDQRQAKRAGDVDCRAQSQRARRSATWRWSAGSRPTMPGCATGVHYHRDGRWRFQKARNVVVAGYAIETPRLLLNSVVVAVSRRACQQFRPGRQEPDGAVEPGGLGHHGPGDPLVQGTAVARDYRTLELRGPGKDFFGGYCYMSQGPLPQLWANTQMSAHGLWGEPADRRDGEVQPPGRAEDRRRNAAAGTQPRHA